MSIGKAGHSVPLFRKAFLALQRPEVLTFVRGSLKETKLGHTPPLWKERFAYYTLIFITVWIPVRINAVTVIYLQIDPKGAQNTSARGRNERPKNTLSRAALLKQGSRRVSKNTPWTGALSKHGSQMLQNTKFRGASFCLLYPENTALLNYCCNAIFAVIQ